MHQLDETTETSAALRSLLPLRAFLATLELTDEARFSFWHQGAVHAFVRHLAGSPPDFAQLLTIDAPESGRTRYRAGERYRFAVLGLAGSEILLARLIGALADLPDSAPVRDARAPLRDNLRLAALADLFTGAPVRAVADLSLYDGRRLAAEIDLWRGAPFVLLQWLSPARLKRAKAQREQGSDRRRYCADVADLGDGVLAARVRDAPASVLRARGTEMPPRQLASGIPAPEGQLFWVDGSYRDANGHSQDIGGLCGRLCIGPGSELAPDWLELLVLGQYLGLGERRAFGLGRYRLTTPDGSTTLPAAESAASLLVHAARDDALYDAYTAMRDNQRERADGPDSPRASNADDGSDDEDPTLPDPEAEADLADRLEAIGRRLATADYRPPALHGVVFRERDGDLRGLAIPPFWDRVAQRAVNDCIAPACELIMDDASHGYRRGRSRHTASLDVNRAWQDGYRWVYEADIEDFFDSVRWDHLRLRLEALYRDDPVVELVLAWMGAPVEYQGMRVERTCGLPQGAPLSPTMANLMLDDFDADLARAGFRLVRYADDFVVLCRSRDDAEAAGQAVRTALAELGLRLNEDKSRAVSFEQGFRFLGFLFMNSLVLDVGGKADSARLAAPQSPPPNSWLARLARKEARPLNATPPAQTARAIDYAADPATSGTAGELGDDGLLLIVTGASALVSSSKGRAVVTRSDTTVADAPWRGLSAVLLLGHHHITTPALRHAMAHGVPVHFASSSGHYQGVAWNHRAGNDGAALWLLQQQRAGESDWTLVAARALVIARIRHMRELLRQRDTGGFRGVREQLQQAITQAGRAVSPASLLGIEGSAARAYFGALAALVPEPYGFAGRNKRPPRDPFNALLSLGYSILHAQTATLLQVDGLYPWRGFYHQSHGAHASLASDLMEPFRHIVERAALAAVGRGGISPEGFRLAGPLGCRLTPESLRRYLVLLWDRLERPLPRVGDLEPHNVMQQLHRQNQRLIRALRDGSDFEPYVGR
jgi:group II intron reverse transcriptase/maturase/CRISPR-associated endonuclease Cas1